MCRRRSIAGRQCGDQTDESIPVNRFGEVVVAAEVQALIAVLQARVGGQGWSVRDDLTIESDESITEDLVLDSLPIKPPRAPINIFVPIFDAVRVAAPTRSIERKWTRHTLLLEDAP